MPEQQAAPQVIHQQDRQRFTMTSPLADGDDPEMEYRIIRGRMAMLHTYVPEELEGKGLAAALVTAGLEYARAEGLKVLPYCPYVAVFVQRKAPEWDDVVAEIGEEEAE